MANSIQLFLSPRPPRTNTSKDDRIKGVFNACSAWFQKEDGHLYVYEEHFVSTHPKAQGGLKSESGPPPHIHLYQKEYFACEEGVLGIVCDGKTVYLKPGETAEVPIGSRHRFFPAEGGGKSGNCILKVRVDEYSGGFDERFIRNCFSYLSDCDKHGVAPSLPQLALFLYAHDILLDIPLPLILLKPLLWFISYVIGAWLLGYQATYPEYYNDPSSVGTEQEVKKEL